ncbi:MAG TPA: hypothetical protein VFA92_10015, partial [Candidatus Binatia bacterium]|nr:hypothetical protein [Candidatus Binatia bacterium]
FPMTRDELVEGCALLAGVRAGRLDAVLPPRRPLDVLAQQIVAECAAREWSEDALFELCRRAQPFAELAREDFDEIVDLVADGIATGRGKVAAYVHRDRANGTLKGRRGARLAALTSGGAIPETGDYRVVAEPDETFIGTVNEDWAIESNAGDIFLLGSTSWRILRVSGGTVRVADANGAPPTVPFWLGEAPARTWELSDEVSQIGAAIEPLLAAGNADGAVAVVEERCGVDNEVAASVVWYLAAGRSALGRLPTQDHLIVERFFDDSGGMQVVVHSPFGGRLNRALGLALRKRFCMTFDFELQAAATENGALLSIGPQHSFPLDELLRFLSSGTVEEVLRKAAILAPMFQVRWRHTLNRALTVLRFRGGRKNPPPLQRLQSDDVMVAVFPALAACQENATGPVEIVDHPLVQETLWDCLHDFMDVDGLRTIVGGIERGEIAVTCRDTTEPSVLAHEILNSQPYTFLDDAPLEERRSRNLSLPRGLPLDPHDLSALDGDAIARVREEAKPEPRDADELHDLLMAQVLVPPRPEWEEWFAALADRRRAVQVDVAGGVLWCAAEWRAQVDALLEDPLSAPEACAAAVRGHLETLGPVTAADVGARTSLPLRAVEMGLAALEAEGFAFRGRFDPSLGSAEQWCARRLLLRIHGYTRQRLRREIEPVTPADLMRFLLRWQRVAPGAQH